VSKPKSFVKLSNSDEKLDFWDVFKVDSLPDSFGSLKSLRKLSLLHSPIELLPESFGELSSLEELKLRCCEKLTALPESFGGVRNLLKDVGFGAVWS
jgi:Leucine-rich repeat (LRR) protein